MHCDRHVISFLRGIDIFLNHNGIGTIRHIGAGKNTHRLTGFEVPGPGMTGRRFADTDQFCRTCGNICCPNSIAIHCRDIMRRQCQFGRNIIRQKPSQRLAERNGRAAGRFQRV